MHFGHMFHCFQNQNLWQNQGKIRKTGKMSCAETPLEIHIEAKNMIVLLTLHANSRVQQPVQCMMAKKNGKAP